MNRKILWLLVSCLAALSLVLPSCAPAVTEEEKVEEEVVEEEVVEEGVVKEKKPKYGGTLIYSRKSDVSGFDQIYTGVGWDNAQFMTSNALLVGDWTRDAAGTGEFDFAAGAGFCSSGQMEEVGEAAESFEIPDDHTLIFHIRKGMHFALNPKSEASRLVNGREFTAEDAVYSIKYMYLNPKVPMAYNRVTGPGGNTVTDVYIDPNDPWTVIVKVTGMANLFLEDIGVKGTHMIAPEVVEKYGDLKNWRNSVGTGPFILMDYVPGSSVTFVKNPNYWLKNSIGPGKGDQLPYVDGVKWLIIVDMSTNLAAFRTGKIDITETVDYENWADMMKTNPQTKWRKALATGMQHVAPNNYQVPNPLIEPFYNRRVRWALSMAIDREAIIRDYYMGEAIIFVSKILPSSPYYTTFDEKVEILERVFGMKPEEAIWAKKAWEYHPDEARKILAEEGYPNGFKTKVMCPPASVDWISIIASFWSEIGVELELDVRDSVIYSNIRDAHTYPGLQSSGTISDIGTNPRKFIQTGVPKEPTGLFPLANYNYYWDPVLREWEEKTYAVAGHDELIFPLFQELEAYYAWNVHVISIPGYNKFHIWQPWLKNCYGYYALGFRGHYDTFSYHWIDQELKKKMGR